MFKSIHTLITTWVYVFVVAFLGFPGLVIMVQQGYGTEIAVYYTYMTLPLSICVLTMTLWLCLASWQSNKPLRMMILALSSLFCLIVGLSAVAAFHGALSSDLFNALRGLPLLVACGLTLAMTYADLAYLKG